MSKKSKAPIEANGKIEDGQPTMLEQVWGYNELARYGTLKEEEYNAVIMDMNRPELESHARKLGVMIVESSARLQENLRKEFRQYIASLRRPNNPSPKSSKADVDEVKKILSDGR